MMVNRFASAACRSYFLGAGVALLAGTASLAAAVPSRLNLHGQVNLAGAPVEGTVPITFRLYEQEAGGIAIWEETVTVSCSAGYFSALLGSSQPIDADLVMAVPALYLGLSISGNDELTPRLALASVSYALGAQRAAVAESLDCAACITPPQVAFAYAGSTAAGGAANDLDCVAASCISTPELDNAAVTTAKLADSAVATAKIADAAVTPAKLAPSCAEGDVLVRAAGGWSCKHLSLGSTFVRWGTSVAPSNSTLLYSGWGFNEHYTHPGGSEAICVKPGDPGGTGPGSNYSDLLYPLGTGDAGRMPPGIPATKEIKCAVCHVEGPVVEMWGTSTCPGGWTAMYTGYAMGGYYNHANPSRRHCVDNVSFDGSVNNPNWGDIWYGTVIHDTTDLPGGTFTANTYVKCALCARL